MTKEKESELIHILKEIVYLNMKNSQNADEWKKLGYRITDLQLEYNPKEEQNKILKGG